MSANDDLELDVAEIRNELSRQGGLLRTLVYAQAGPIGEIVIAAMEADPILARIYLLLARPLSQVELVAELNGAGAAGTSQSSISRKMERLEELGVIAPVGSHGRATKFAQNEAAAALKINSLIKRSKILKDLR